MRRKHDRDLANECKIAVFKVKDVAMTPQLKFKIDMNA